VDKKEERARKIMGMFYDWDKEREVLSRYKNVNEIGIILNLILTTLLIKKW